MKKLFLTLLLILLSNVIIAQLPIKKELQKGITSVKKIMKNEGFHFVKETIDKNYILLLYREEFSISIFSNEFENIESINISTGNEIILKKIETIIDFNKWKYLYSEKDRITGIKENVYQIFDYYARYYHNPKNKFELNGKDIEYQYILFK